VLGGARTGTIPLRLVTGTSALLAAKARPRVDWVTLFCTGGGKIASNCYDYLHSANHTLGGTR
jgi:hypothetical protein